MEVFAAKKHKERKDHFPFVLFAFFCRYDSSSTSQSRMVEPIIVGLSS